ncbi:putative oxidoreductase [Lachnellula willkommii]|uniref:Putative oxidoreductase n=1 Tax=Lachnellula willkommii TaxID=215461 RepID=A0A559M1T9_9HELO|nr:putative oxidoreductase [Lachnellula willkommii]
MAPWTLVSPASRGIGFHLTRHLLRNTTLPIVATARKDVEGVRKSMLEGLKDVDQERLKVLSLDVTDESTISKAAEETKQLFPLDKNHLHLAFCIPGILHPEKSPAQLEHEQLTHAFAVNTIGPMLMFKHFSNFLPKKSTDMSLPASRITLPEQAVWLNMAARVGSTTDNKLGGWYSYRASKAAVNSVTKGEDIFVRQRSGDNAMVMSYHPGTVKTGLSREFWGGVPEEKLFTPEFAVEKMVGVVGSVGLQGRGKCWDWMLEEVLP